MCGDDIGGASGAHFLSTGRVTLDPTADLGAKSLGGGRGSGGELVRSIGAADGGGGFKDEGLYTAGSGWVLVNNRDLVVEGEVDGGLDLLVGAGSSWGGGSSVLGGWGRWCGGSDGLLCGEDQVGGVGVLL